MGKYIYEFDFELDRPIDFAHKGQSVQVYKLLIKAPKGKHSKILDGLAIGERSVGELLAEGLVFAHMEDGTQEPITKYIIDNEIDFRDLQLIKKQYERVFFTPSYLKELLGEQSTDS